MKFRIIRNGDCFQPQAWDENIRIWYNISNYSYPIIELARGVCISYKKKRDNPIVEEFEL